MISGLLVKPRQRFKTLSKNRCLPTVPTEALRRLWADSGPSGLMSQRRGSADSRPSALTLERGGSTAKPSFVTRLRPPAPFSKHPPAAAARAAPECKQCRCRQNMNCRRCKAVYSSKLSALEGSPLSCLASTDVSVSLCDATAGGYRVQHPWIVALQ